jgi:hypothetical protein
MFPILTEEQIIQNIDLEDDKTYKWEGESLTIINIDLTLEAQRDQTLKDVVKWGDERCSNQNHPNYKYPKRKCLNCWAELRKQAGME